MVNSLISICRYAGDEKTVVRLRTGLENVAYDVTLSCDAAEWMIEETVTRRRRVSVARRLWRVSELEVG